MKYHYALVPAYHFAPNSPLAYLAAETDSLVENGWIMKPPGLRDYIADAYSVRPDDIVSFLLGYYARWLVNEPMNQIVLSDDLTYLLLFKPEIAYLSDEPVALERFRQDLIDGFVAHEVASVAPRYRALMKLATRTNPYADDDDIIKHCELIKDQWRDTPMSYWGPPFPMNGYT